MYKFKMPCPGLFIGAINHRTIKDSNENATGEITTVRLEYRGGFVQVEVDRAFAEKLIPDSEGTAIIEMTPCMSGQAISTKKGDFAFIKSGFDNFNLVGWEPKDGVKK